MKLNVEEKRIIKLSFTQLLNKQVDIAACFYNNLFDMAPLIKPLFKSDRSVIERHFYDLLSLAVSQIEYFEDLQPVLFELGKRHKKYGAEHQHFAVVKAALILSIQYELKGQCNAALTIAWTKYIDNVSDAMIAGLVSID